MIELSDQNMATNPQCYKDREDYSRRSSSLLCGVSRPHKQLLMRYFFALKILGKNKAFKFHIYIFENERQKIPATIFAPLLVNLT